MSLSKLAKETPILYYVCASPSTTRDILNSLGQSQSERVENIENSWQRYVTGGMVFL